jgi:hypothetical protein
LGVATATSINGTSIPSSKTLVVTTDINVSVQAYNSTLASVAAGTYAGDNDIVTVGTISTGTWSATAIATAKGGTGKTTYTSGDILYYGSGPELSTLSKPASTSVLQMTSGGTPSWVTPSTLSVSSASSADTVKTVNASSGTYYFPTFVDSGNTSAASEIVYTDSSLQYDYSTGIFWIPATKINNTALTKTESTTISANTIATISTIDSASYRSAEYLVQIVQGSKQTLSKVLMIHDGTTANITEYGVVELGASRIPVTLSATLTGGNVLLRAIITDAASTNAAVKVVSTAIVV